MKKEKKVVLLPKDAVMIALVFMMLAILFVLPVAAVSPCPSDNRSKDYTKVREPADWSSSHLGTDLHGFC